MIEASSLIGFALAFLGASWLGSAFLGGLVLLGRRRLGSAGPRAVRRAAACALVLPPALGLSIVLVLSGYSVVGPWLGLPDHCPAHSHHLHLCVFHGTAWAEQPWAVTTVALIGTAVALRAVHHAAALWRARLALRRVARISRRLASPVGELLLAPASTPFCFVAGLLAPRIFVSTGAWERLDANERQAMLAHEQAHAEQGDLWRRSALGAFALFAAPLIAPRLLALWRRATERLCDHRAAVTVGDPEPVVRALVKLSTLGAGASRRAAACFVPTAGEVVDRVEAVLAAGGDGHAAARRIAIGAAIVVTLVLVGSTVFAGPIHHAVESLLGSI